MDWMRFGWGDAFSDTFDKNLKFHIDAFNVQTSSKSLLEVSSRVILEIAEKYPPPYYLMVSGGIDSQAMLWCWMNSAVPFTPISVKYTGADEYKLVLNQHDLAELDIFATQHEIDITYLELNIINFLERELTEYAIKYQCTSPQLCTHMKMSELVSDGTIIFSGNFIDDFAYNYTIMGLKRYADTSGKKCIPFFFLHDSELAGFRHKYEAGSLYEKKIQFYTSLKIPIVPQLNKQTGFEVIKDYYDTRTDLVVAISDRIRFASMPSKRKFDLLFRYELTKKIKYRDEVVILNKNNKY
jgi:hypothetical protein